MPLCLHTGLTSAQSPFLPSSMNTDLGDTQPIKVALWDARSAQGYAVALGGVALAMAAGCWWSSILGSDALYLVFAPTVLLAAALGGGAPGLLAAGLSVVAVLTVEAQAGRAVDGLALGLFLLLSAGLGLVGERMRATRARNARYAGRLLEREAHLQSILDTVPDAMLVIDERGLLQSFSSTAECLFGWTQAEVLGRNISLLMPEPDRTAHDGYINHYIATEERRIIGIGRAVVGMRRDASTFPMHLSVGEMRVADRRFFTGFVRDLTERELTQARLQGLQSELAHLSRLTAMGEMASSLAHELNQPLSAIANYLRGCRRLLEKGNPADQPRLAEALAKAADQAIRAGEVIQRLRQFVGRGETDTRMESLPGLIEEASTLALTGANELGIRISRNFDPSCATALVDRVQIQQVVVNLLRNAVDAMRTTPRRELEISVKPDPDGFIVVSISDTGSGISDQTLPRLFEPFMTTKKDGMGVGLSICRTIIEAHGGTIGAKNNLTGGATFTFTLPNINEAVASD